jgi:hypothetical protein
MDWNVNKDGLIVAGSYDGKLTTWDANNITDGNRVSPLCDFVFHEREIEDVSFNHFHESIFTSCDD